MKYKSNQPYDPYPIEIEITHTDSNWYTHYPPEDPEYISKWLREGEEVEELRKQIETLQQDIKRIKQVVKELIDISHIDKDKKISILKEEIREVREELVRDQHERWSRKHKG